MTHPVMRPRLLPLAALALFLGLSLAGLTGCNTLHAWTQLSSDHTPTAGASMSVPLGK